MVNCHVCLSILFLKQDFEISVTLIFARLARYVDVSFSFGFSGMDLNVSPLGVCTSRNVRSGSGCNSGSIFCTDFPGGIRRSCNFRENAWLLHWQSMQQLRVVLSVSVESFFDITSTDELDEFLISLDGKQVVCACGNERRKYKRLKQESANANVNANILQRAPRFAHHTNHSAYPKLQALLYPPTSTPTHFIRPWPHTTSHSSSTPYPTPDEPHTETPQTGPARHQC